MSGAWFLSAVTYWLLEIQDCAARVIGSFFWLFLGLELFWRPEGLGNLDTRELGFSVLNLYMFSQDVLTKMSNVVYHFYFMGT